MIKQKTNVNVLFFFSSVAFERERKKYERWLQQKYTEEEEKNLSKTTLSLIITGFDTYLYVVWESEKERKEEERQVQDIEIRTAKYTESCWTSRTNQSTIDERKFSSRKFYLSFGFCQKRKENHISFNDISKLFRRDKKKHKKRKRQNSFGVWFLAFYVQKETEERRTTTSMMFWSMELERNLLDQFDWFVRCSHVASTKRRERKRERETDRDEKPQRIVLDQLKFKYCPFSFNQSTAHALTCAVIPWHFNDFRHWTFG